MILIVLNLTENIEEEDAHVFVQILMVEEEFGEEGKIFTVDRVFVAIDFKNGHIVFHIAINLISRRMEKRTVFTMPFEFDLKCEKTQAKITDIETVEVVVVDGIRTEVPSISGMPTELETKDCFEFSDFLMGKQFCIVHTEMRVIIWMHVSATFVKRGFLDLEVGLPDARKWNPVIVALV